VGGTSCAFGEAPRVPAKTAAATTAAIVGADSRTTTFSRLRSQRDRCLPIRGGGLTRCCLSLDAFPKDI
jgi:hypothetical protein